MTKLFGLLRRVGGGLVAACLVAAVGSVSVVWAWSQAGDFTVGGNVGIGTTAPTYKLDVNSADSPIRLGPNTSFSRSLLLGGWGTDTSEAWIRASNGNLHLDSKDGSQIYLNHYNDENIYLSTGGGNVGIGTANPTEKLEVTGNVAIGHRWNTANPTHAVNVGKPDEAGSWNAGSAYIQFKDYAHNAGVNAGTSIAFHSHKWGGGTNEAMRVAANGNVGIGTTNPTYKLDVNSADNPMRIGPNTSFSRSLLLGGWGTDTSEAWIRASNGNLHLDSKDGSQIYLNHYNDENIYLSTGGGNVGIGTANPTEKLEVTGNVAIGHRWNTANPTHAVNVGKPDEAGSWNAGSAYIQFKDYAHNAGVNAGTSIAFHSHKWGGGTNEAMRVAANGNVGIGTTSPTYKLDVNSADSPMRIGPNTSFSRSLLLGGWGTDTSEAWIRASNGNLHLDSKDGSQIYLNHYNDENIYLSTGGGNVGIGTTDPTEKLEVSGNLKISGDIKTTGDICIGRCAN